MSVVGPNMQLSNKCNHHYSLGARASLEKHPHCPAILSLAFRGLKPLQRVDGVKSREPLFSATLLSVPACACVCARFAGGVLHSPRDPGRKGDGQHVRCPLCTHATDKAQRGREKFQFWFDQANPRLVPGRTCRTCVVTLEYLFTHHHGSLRHVS